MSLCRCLVAGLMVVLLVGCSETYSGKWDARLQLMDGKPESDEFPLVMAEKRFSHQQQSIELKRSGRYVQQVGASVHEGEWWTEDGRIGLRCDRRNGRDLGATRKSAETDWYFAIREGQLVRGPWSHPDTNIEVVYVRRR